MSFDVNIGRSEPIIKAASGTNNDGGSGGNLGYMMGGRQKKKEEQGSLFDKNKNASDTFELSSKKLNNDIFDYPEDKSWFSGLFKKFSK